MRTLALFTLFAAASFAQSLPTVFIAPMEGQLDGFIAAEIIKQHVPMKVVTEEKDAQFTLSGMSAKELVEKRFYYHRESDQNIGNVRLVDIRSGTMIWAGEAGDRSLTISPLYVTDWAFSKRRRDGLRKVAQRIVERMKKESFDGKSAPLATAFGGHHEQSGWKHALLADGAPF